MRARHKDAVARTRELDEQLARVDMRGIVSAATARSGHAAPKAGVAGAGSGGVMWDLDVLVSKAEELRRRVVDGEASDRKALATVERERAMLQEEIVDLEASVEDGRRERQEELRGASESVSMMRRQADSGKEAAAAPRRSAETEVLQTKLFELEDEVRALNSEIDGLNDDLDEAQADKDDMGMELAAAQQQLVALEERVQAHTNLGASS